MTTLSQHYAKKAKNGTGTTTKKTFMVPYEELYLVPGENIRPLDEAHARRMGELWKKGVEFPALEVVVTEKGVKVVHGQHRLVGAGYAREDGFNVARIECTDAPKDPLKQLAQQVGGNDGLAMTPLVRAEAYRRARVAGYEISEIAEEFHRSVTDVESHLALISLDADLTEMVKRGEISKTTAIALNREHGPKSGRVAKHRLNQVKAAGKKKLTTSAAMQQFSARKARRLVELLVDAEAIPHGDGMALSIVDGTWEEIERILAEYRAGISQDSGEVETFEDNLTQRVKEPAGDSV